MLVRLEVLVVELVLVVLINERVVLQKCMGYLERKIRVDVSGLLVVEGVVGLSWDDVGED